MSAPILSNGGQAVLVTQQVTLLTEYAPVTVINTSVTDLIYLASDSNVSPATGVPVEPSTAYVWQTPGPLYAIGDVANSDGGAQIVMTGSSDAWQPSPVTIGAAIAAELAATGITTKLDIVALGAYSITAGAVNSTVDPLSFGFPDLAQYGSVFMYAVAAGSGTYSPIEYQWGIRGSGVTTSAKDALGFVANTSPAYTLGVTTPVLGSTLKISNPNLTSLTLVLFGYNQRVSAAPIGNGSSSTGFVATMVLPAGTTPAALNLIPVTFGEKFQGPAQVYVRFLYNAPHALDGFGIFIGMVPGQYLGFTDSSQLAAFGPQGYTQYAQRAFPAAPFDLYVQVIATISASVTVLVQAIPFK